MTKIYIIRSRYTLDGSDGYLMTVVLFAWGENSPIDTLSTSGRGGSVERRPPLPSCLPQNRVANCGRRMYVYTTKVVFRSPVCAGYISRPFRTVLRLDSMPQCKGYQQLDMIVVENTNRSRQFRLESWKTTSRLFRSENIRWVLSGTWLLATQPRTVAPP